MSKAKPMSGVCPRGGGGGGEQQQVVVGGGRDEVSGGRGGCLSFYHVPQQSRREKLRYPNTDERPRWPPHTLPPPPSLFHCDDTPLSAATATASFMPPSSSLLLNPSYNATPYEPDIAPVHLLDDHPLFGGTHGHQVQGVSLSLSSAGSPSHHNDQHNHGIPVCAPALTGQLPPVLSAAPRIGPVPAGPFTGYATILQGSRFLRPAQQLLEDVCGGGGTMWGAMVCSGGEVESLDLAADGVEDCGENVDGMIGDGEHRMMKSRLLSMLDEVCRRYKQYCQQIQAVITSFEAVAGLNTAAPYTLVALRSLSKHFKCLKSVISEQLQFTTKALGKEGLSEEEITGYRIMNGNFCYKRAAHSPGTTNQQPVWRPQRGLPERAVTVLRAWLFEHFLHPYPTDMDKQMLAKQTGLSRNQVSNWFINARVRLWKPMVEEIHSLELQQVHNIPENNSPHDTNKHQDFSSTSTVSPNDNQAAPFDIPQKISHLPCKRLRDELVQLPNHIKEPFNFSLDDPSAHHRAGVPMGFASTAANGGISLTLGLHQNDGVCLSEPLPLNVVHRFGLEESSVAYVMGGFEGQERHFGRDFDGQLLRHFVA